MRHRSDGTFGTLLRAMSTTALTASLLGCGTWQHNVEPAASLATPRVVERDLSGGVASAAAVDRTAKPRR